MNLPIITVDRGGTDLIIFDSIKDAEGYLEAIDVRNEEYFAYDAGGKLLQLEAKGNRVFVKAEDASPHTDELAKSLREFLDAVGKPVKNPTLMHDLPSLIEACRACGCKRK